MRLSGCGQAKSIRLAVDKQAGTLSLRLTTEYNRLSGSSEGIVGHTMVGAEVFCLGVFNLEDVLVDFVRVLVEADVVVGFQDAVFLQPDE